MALNDAALVLAANAVDTAVAFMQAHSADPGSDGAGFEMGSRTAVNGSVDAGGDITWVVPFTGLTASTAFWGISMWSASSGGTHYGNVARTTGDTTTNSAGEFTATITESFTAS